jgi:hypothetical protein
LSIAFILVFLLLPPQALATFEMSLGAGYRSIDFGPMELGQEKTLSRRGGYEHQFNLTSDNARTWYFKAQLIRPFTSGRHSIPVENLQWIVEEVRSGRGIVSTGISRPSSFSRFPALIYTSADSDNSGTEVQVRLRYKLTIPDEQAAGAYTAHIRFIMVEQL